VSWGAAALSEGVAAPELFEELSPACTLEVLPEQDASAVRLKKTKQPNLANLNDLPNLKDPVPRIFEHPFFESAVRNVRRTATGVPQKKPPLDVNLSGGGKFRDQVKNV
jgi:hypothetical protein